MELWNGKFAFFHGTIFFPHTPKVMVNAVTTSLPTAECSALGHSLFFSTIIMFIISSPLLIPPAISVYVHFSMFPSPYIVFYNFSIVLSTFVFLQTLKLHAANEINSQRLLHLFSSLSFPHI
jgi:hypothetical protein